MLSNQHILDAIRANVTRIQVSPESVEYQVADGTFQGLLEDLEIDPEVVDTVGELVKSYTDQMAEAMQEQVTEEKEFPEDARVSITSSLGKHDTAEIVVTSPPSPGVISIHTILSLRSDDPPSPTLDTVMATILDKIAKS